MPTTAEAVIVLLLAIAPGYVGIATWACAKTWKGFGGDLDTALRALAVSLLLQVPMFPLAIRWRIYADLTDPNKFSLAPGQVFAWPS